MGWRKRFDMAMVAINSMNTQRETFKDTDSVRVHQIITHGGDLLNSVPALVEAEVCVRAMNIPALLAANEKINRCIMALPLLWEGMQRLRIPLADASEVLRCYGRHFWR